MDNTCDYAYRILDSSSRKMKFVFSCEITTRTTPGRRGPWSPMTSLYHKGLAADGVHKNWHRKKLCLSGGGYYLREFDHSPNRQTAEVSNKGVRETESQTGTRLVSPGRRPRKKKFDPSTYRHQNTILTTIMTTQLSKMLYVAIGNGQRPKRP